MARSALSALGITCEGVPIGSHPVIIRLLKGIFNKKPPKVKHTTVWDVDILLKHMQTMPAVQDLCLKDITLKLAMLMALTKAARPQTLHLLTLRNIKKTNNEYVLELADLQKHSRPGMHRNIITIRAFPHDKALCPYTILEEYIQKTKTLRSTEEQLFISFIKPHKQVSRDTIRRWLRTMMKNAGIDIERYGAYSTRAASVSKAALLNISMDQIMKTAGWTRQSTFEKFYHKEVVGEQNYDDVLLNLDIRHKDNE